MALATLVWALVAGIRFQPRDRVWWPESPPGPNPPVGAAPSPPAEVPSLPAAPSATVEAEPEPPVPFPEAAPSPLASPPAPVAHVPNLLIPVAGVRPEQLRDTFNDARSEGRVHNAIDIPAPRGTPVVAAADGRIVKLFESERGGLTIYQLSADEKLVYYYAHLDRYADNLAEGHVARRGEVIGYVGDTGNAGPGNYHLHFSISLISDPKRYWEGVNINPYPLLKR